MSAWSSSACARSVGLYPSRMIHGVTALPGGWSSLSWVFAVTALVLTVTTARGRGLPGILSARQLTDARES